MTTQNDKCQFCTADLQDKDSITIVSFDTQKENEIQNVQSFCPHCYTDEVAGEDHIYSDNPSDEQPNVGSICPKCENDDKTDHGVAIFQISAEGQQVWMQYFHLDCFLENAGKDFFDV